MAALGPLAVRQMLDTGRVRRGPSFLERVRCTAEIGENWAPDPVSTALGYLVDEVHAEGDGLSEVTFVTLWPI